MGPIGSKVIEVKGQIYVVFFPPRSLGRSSPNLVVRLRAAPDISSRGSFFKGQGHRVQSSNFCISAVLGPICMKLSECIHRLIPDYDLWVQLGQRSSRSKVKFMFFPPRSLCRSSPNLEGRWRAAPDISLREKVKVIEVKGQISVSRQSNLCFFLFVPPRSLGRS